MKRLTSLLFALLLLACAAAVLHIAVQICTGHGGLRYCWEHRQWPSLVAMLLCTVAYTGVAAAGFTLGARHAWRATTGH